MLRFALTVVLSAFLLFLVQPLVGKVVLPWFGGTPAVWMTCLLFFQVTLLGGYLWSHLVVRRFTRWQRPLHLALLAIAVAVLASNAWLWPSPLSPPDTLRPDITGNPTLTLLGLLTRTVGLPYFALASTGPLLQAWVARSVATTTAMRLYAVSNLGSLGGLLAFPVALEPFFALPTLSWLWSGGFLLFAIACGTLAWSQPSVTAAPATDSPLPLGRAARWVTLATIPSALLLAVTNRLTQDVAPIPFLWVVPLVLYLLSFVVTFDNERWYRRALVLPAMGAFGLLASGLLLFPVEPSPLVALVGYCGFLFTVCVAAHGELIRNRPAGEHLTAFYVSVSIGGAIGGLTVAVIAPLIFNDFLELQVISAAGVVWLGFEVLRNAPSARGPRIFLGATVVLAVLFGWSIASRDPALLLRRDFFGVLRVERDSHGVLLMHGRIVHGAQWKEPGKNRLPTTYYGLTSGVGLYLTQRAAPTKVGAIGLGVGTLAAYVRPGDQYRFYEISPAVQDIAEGQGGHFSFLKDAPVKPEVIIGDARTSLEAEAPNAYDVLVVDAFSGDAVPTHLLTTEAFEVYFRHLAPEGVIALHVSNRYLELLPVVTRLAKHHQLHGVIVASDDPDALTLDAVWVLVSKADVFKPLQVTKGDRFELDFDKAGPLWTDGFTSLLGLVRW